MNLRKCLLALFLTMAISFNAFAQGLKFTGLEKPIEKRTSFDVFSSARHEFSGHLVLSFDLALYPESAIGYILRIKDSGNGKVYNLFYDGQGSSYSFMLNDEGHTSMIHAEIGRDSIEEQSWVGVSLDFDMEKDSVYLRIKDRKFSAPAPDLPEGRWAPEINFGKSDYIIDVPSFAIRNLYVGDGKKEFFPLKERSGNIVHDSKGRSVGKVTNPYWLMNDFYEWKKLPVMQSSSVSCSCYSQSRKEVYYFDRDTVRILDVRSGQVTSRAFRNRCPVVLALGTCFLDDKNGKIYAYEVWYENEDISAPTVAMLDLRTLEWRAVSADRLPMQMHHHGSFFDSARSKYIVFGGFGNMHYNGTFYMFDLHTGHWNPLTGITGDRICPRYFTSMGFDSKTSTLYVYGGMGNDSGEQAVGRRYLYDLYSLDFSGKVTKLWDTDLGAGNIVPVRNMYVDGSGYFYTLCYPESLSKSELTLYKFSIEDGSYETIADAIPITSDRITTNANICYDPSIEKMFALVYESPDDVSSTLTVYSLSLLPVSESGVAGSDDAAKSWKRILTAAGIAIAVCLAFAFVYGTRRKKTATHESGNANRENDISVREPETLPSNAESVSSVPSAEDNIVIIPNSIYLFGGFSAINGKGRDVTFNFTPMQQKLFCVVLSFSAAGGGISPSHLGALLWPDRPKDSVKSLRNATLNHLRKSLSQLEGVKIVYDENLYKIETAPPFYCDYIRFHGLVSSESHKDPETAELTAILSRGKFLDRMDDICLDSFKSSVEQAVLSIVPSKMRTEFRKKEYDKVLSLADVLFGIDPMSELALRYTLMTLARLNRKDEASIRYSAFVAQYKDIYSEPYPYSLEELLEQPS